VSFIGYRNTKFQSNPSTQTTVTAVFERYPKTPVSNVCGWR